MLSIFKGELFLLLAQFYIVMLIGAIGASYITKRLRTMRSPRRQVWS